MSYTSIDFSDNNIVIIF